MMMVIGSILEAANSIRLTLCKPPSESKPSKIEYPLIAGVALIGKISFCFALCGCVLFATSCRKHSESTLPSESPKKELYSFIGAISQHDWEYVWENSTEGFHNYVNYTLIVVDGLKDNKKLAQLVEQHVDSSEFEKLSGENPPEYLEATGRAVNDSKTFFVNGMNSLSPPYDLGLTVPSGIKEISKEGKTYVAIVTYDSVYDSMIKGVEVRGKITLEFVGNDWVVSESRMIEPDLSGVDDPVLQRFLNMKGDAED